MSTLSELTLDASGGSTAGPAADRARCPPRRARDEAGYERWLAQQSERLDPFMALLGVLFALIVAFELADPGLSAEWQRVLRITTWAIWAVFVADFAVKAIAAPSAVRFVRRNWLAALMLVVPTLRLLRFGALLRLGRVLPTARVLSTSYRATGVARTLLRSRAGYLGGLAGIATVAVAQLGWLAERGHATFPAFGDALLWSASVVVALQGDPTPASAWGRLAMIGGFVVGLVLITSLAGAIGAYLLEGRRERQSGS